MTPQPVITVQSRSVMSVHGSTSISHKVLHESASYLFAAGNNSSFAGLSFSDYIHKKWNALHVKHKGNNHFHY